MEFESTAIADVLLIKPRVHRDQRGFFTETYRRSVFAEHGINEIFVQDNLSSSVRHTLRGLHYQIKQQQAKLVSVTLGEILDVAVDLRRDSPTFAKHVMCRLSAEGREMLYIPGGFAHGFFVLSSQAVFSYKCSDYYCPEAERGIRWNDPDLAIPWPEDTPVLSEKDRSLPYLADLLRADLPGF